MKKNLLIFGILLNVFSLSNAQDFCATDEIQKRLESKNPSLIKEREDAEKKMLSLDIKNFLSSRKIKTDVSGKYVGPIYTIPVVVHIIVPNGEALGSEFNPSDAQIQTWINNTNAIFATTKGGIFSAEGVGNNDGTVIPFQLVLAKRKKDCTATTGIERYDGSSLTNYATYGVNINNNTGVSRDQITSLAPHWSESSYYNIYVVKGFDGNFAYTAKNGFAGFPNSPNSDYHAFMKSGLVTGTSDFSLGILPHEMGHSLGLLHTFSGNGTVCSTNNNCDIDNDKVCDTSPNIAYLNPLPDNTMINPCTNQVYDGIQYNMMSYNSSRKFTPGQRDRALVQFLAYRENLTQSLGATDIVTNPGIGGLSATSCTIANPNNSINYGKGPRLVKLGTINNISGGRDSENDIYYTDYSVENCINPGAYTDLTIGQSYTLQVNIKGNPQYIQAWIDYNNNGSFEASELVATSVTQVPTPNGFASDAVWMSQITPPATATLNTPLRFRVRASGETGACTTPSQGQVEDYTVILKQSSVLKTNEKVVNNKFVITYSKDENKLISNKVIGDYKIYDMSGKLMQYGNSRSKEINLNFNLQGTYIISNDKYNIKFNK